MQMRMPGITMVQLTTSRPQVQGRLPQSSCMLLHNKALRAPDLSSAWRGPHDGTAFAVNTHHANRMFAVHIRI